MKVVTSVFNLQTSFLLVGVLLVVAGLWLLLGYQFGMIALGVACIAIALVIDYEQRGG